MTLLYAIEEQSTTGWNKLDQQYRHLTREECKTKYDFLLLDGANPEDLRIVRDDIN